MAFRQEINDLYINLHAYIRKGSESIRLNSSDFPIFINFVSFCGVFPAAAAAGLSAIGLRQKIKDDASLL